MRYLVDIILAPLVERLKATNYPIPSSSRFYPDGSILNDGFELGDRIRNILKYEPQGYGTLSFRPLAAFGGSHSSGNLYTLTYPGWYDWFVCDFDELGTGAAPGGGRLISKEDEFDLEHVHVMIKLYRKIGKPLAEELADIVRLWFANIGSKGVFGEGGISSISPIMHHRSRDAGFELNAEGSGQETLNTLILAVFNWAMETRRPLCVIDIAANRYEKVFSSDLFVNLGQV